MNSSGVWRLSVAERGREPTVDIVRAQREISARSWASILHLPEVMPMDANHWARVRELFESIADLPPEQRAAALAAAAVDDEVRAQVRRLLTADADTAADARIAPPAPLLEAALRPAQLPVEQAGQRIGPWRLLQQLGRGGMGSVWLAERMEVGFEQRAAIKLIRTLQVSAESRARFAAEQRMLARLSHPHIAHLIDGGISEDGRPYLAIEYVEGQSLTRHAQARALDPLARVRLFLDVCAAVAHAHQHLIVHRDLKPSNILVGANGRVKLLDFGIAKLLDEEGAEDGLTATGVRLYTPGYAAPEQLRGEAIGTAADVYALGVVLYELLSGRLPFEVQSQSPADWERAVLTQEPTPPSRDTASLDTTRRNRAPPQSLLSLPRALRGDIDAVVLKALRREVDQRYPSVTALAADLEALLDGRPVSARRGSRRYRLAKFLRRHALAATLGGAAVLALVLGAGLALWQASVAAQERDHARRQALTAERSTRFLTDVFKLADPGEARGASISARDLLDRGARSIEFELAGEPEVRSHLRMALGEAYGGLGLAAESLALAEQAWADAQSSPDPVLRARALRTLALAQSGRGMAHESEATLRRALAIALPPETLAQTLRAELELALASALMGGSRLDEAQPWFEAGFARQKAVLGAMDPAWVVPYSSYLHARGRVSEAETLLRDALARVRRERAPDDPLRVSLAGQYAVNLVRQGRSAEAIEWQQEALQAKRAIYGDSHPSVDITRHNLGRSLADLGRWDEAAAIYLELLPRLRERDGPRHQRTAAAEAALARIYTDTDRASEALPLWESALAGALALWGEVDMAVGIVRLGRGRSLAALDRPAEALAELDRAIATYAALGNPGHGGLARARSERARVLLALDRQKDAVADAAEAVSALAQAAPLAQAYALAVQAETLQQSGRHEDALSSLGQAEQQLAKAPTVDSAEARYIRTLAQAM